MIIADYLSYKPLKVYDQGKTKYCTAYAFFAVLSEFVQQEYGFDVEFDIEKYFKEMEEYRLIVRAVNKTRVRCFIDIGRSKGYRAKTGELVKIHGSISFPTGRVPDKICEYLQKFSPGIFTVDRYKKHNLNDTIIQMVDEDDVKKKAGHAMMMIGFDKQKKLFQFQNSWGKGYDQYMPFNVYEQIGKYCYFIKHVTIET